VPSPRVSRYHAELSVDAGGARVRDLGSTNGTAVEGRPVREAELHAGDRVAFGGVEARLIERAAAGGTDAANA
jgi:pSer/pThr/pTyr-binding forkhead associated (FHA) protein